MTQTLDVQNHPIRSLGSPTAPPNEKVNTEKLNQYAVSANTANTLQRTLTEESITKQEKVRIDTALSQLAKTRAESQQADAIAARLVQQGMIDRSEMGQFLAWMARAKELGLGLDTVSNLLFRRRPGAAFPDFPSPGNNFSFPKLIE